jgi:hypothetical protein
LVNAVLAFAGEAALFSGMLTAVATQAEGALLPPGMLRTTTRIRVSTRARAWSATRIGLTFEQVGVEALALLGFDLTKLVPQLSIPLLRLPGSNRAGADSDASPAYFEVGYLDRELLVIQQNQPGGTFALVRETEEELRMRDLTGR